MSTLARAIAIAAEAHSGQVDRGGQPYILHPLRVMMQMEDDGERIVAVLHDVVEDSPAWGIERLKGEGFHPIALSAIVAVTKVPGETYTDFISRCSRNAIGRKVKLADLWDNMNLQRLGRAPDDDDLRRMVRYQNAVAALTTSTPASSKDSPEDIPVQG